MKQRFKLLYAGLFFVLLFLPAALFPFFKNDASLEKRQLAALPAYVADGRLNLQFSDQFESWVSDHLPLRAGLLTASNTVQGELLHGQTANVIVGRDGWLFFASEAPDYLGTAPMTEDQLRSLVITLGLIQARVGETGGHFTLAVAPNKSSVYPEQMPARYRPAAGSDLLRLQDALSQAGVQYADLYGVLTAHKDEGVYHRRDSHWNYRGALYGENEILRSLGRGPFDLDGVLFSVERTWRGDLDKLLLPLGGVLDEQIVCGYDHAPFRFTRPQGVQDAEAQLAIYMSDREERDMWFATKNERLSDGSSLFMVRDSFGRALLPWMIDRYENAVFRRMDQPDLSDLAPGTDVVYEIAERNLLRMIQAAPFLPAPVRAGISPAACQAGPALCAQTERGGYGVHLYGALPEDAATGDGRVYLVLSQDGSELCLEAFPIYEQKLLPEGGSKGFSAYLFAQLGLSRQYDLTVIAGDTAYPCGSMDFSAQGA